MSAIVVAGDSSGSITIAAPAVAGSGTLTLPVATDTLAGIAATQTLTNKTLVAPALGTPASGVLTNCTGVPASALPAGSVLQVVSAALSGSNTTTSATFVTTNQSATITPTRNTSKIFIIVNATNYSNNFDAKYTIYRGATNLGGGSGSAMLLNHAVDWGTCAINYLDSPATTSSTTYTVYFATTGGTAYFNTTSTSGSITLMEIAA